MQSRVIGLRLLAALSYVPHHSAGGLKLALLADPSYRRYGPRRARPARAAAPCGTGLRGAWTTRARAAPAARLAGHLARDWRHRGRHGAARLRPRTPPLRRPGLARDVLPQRL